MEKYKMKWMVGIFCKDEKRCMHVIRIRKKKVKGVELDPGSFCMYVCSSEFGADLYTCDAPFGSH